MRLNKNTIQVIVAMSVIALAGIVWLQVQLLMSAAEQKEEAFRRSVAAALASISQRLETEETVGKLFVTAMQPAKKKEARIAVMKMTERNGDSNEIRIDTGDIAARSSPGVRAEEMPFRIVGNRIEYSLAKPQHVHLRMFTVPDGDDTVLVDATQAPGEYSFVVDSTRFRSGSPVVHLSTDSASFMMSASHDRTGNAAWQSLRANEREEAVRKTFDRLVFSEQLPIEKRLSTGKLDSVVSATLRELRIDLPFVYGVLSTQNDSARIVNSSGYETALKQSEFKTKLFPGDLFAEPNQLALFFPDRKVFLLKQMSPMIAATIVFMSVIVIGFGYTVRTVFKQKRASAMMVDFINNMTHEFKTPISTISLASEAIAREDVLPHADKVIRYNNVIHDENTRMRHGVEKILQMALLEDGDYELQMKPVDVHDIIKNAVANITLQVENKQGKITTELNATRSIVHADVVHLTNIIHNVLDNANKYSPDIPCITVSTENHEESLSIQVRDEGIGMSDEDAKHAFDKYFRVPTGNQHDVRGFGIGLSYVRLMVEAHEGDVNIQSAIGKGTVIEIRLPLNVDQP